MSTQLSNVAESMILTDNGERKIARGGGHPWSMGSGIPAGLSPAGEVVRRWHNDVHLGAFSTCTEQPCDAVRRVE